MGEPAKEGERAARVFLSYSRSDRQFLGRLSDALAERGYLADFDQSQHDPDGVEAGIAATDEWWLRLQTMIAAANVIVFAVSPSSAASPVCDEEIAYARSLGKRVIPILVHAIDFARAPPRLSALNVRIDFSSAGLGFDEALAQLCRALDQDVEWLREAARLTIAAKEWQEAGRADHFLMRGASITRAEAWSARRPQGAPEPGETVRAFIAESRAAETAGHERELARVKRQRALQRGVGVLLFMVAVGAIGFGFYAVLQARSTSRQVSLVLADASQRAVERGDEAQGVRFAVLAARSGLLSPAAPEGEPSLARAAAASHSISELHADEDVEGAAFTPDGARAVTWTWSGAVVLWEIGSGVEIARFDHGRCFPLYCTGGGFSNDGAMGFSFGADGRALLWNAATGGLIAERRHEGGVTGMAVAFDNGRVLSWGADGVVRVWDLASGADVVRQERDPCPSDAPRCVSAGFFPGATQAMSSIDDGTLVVWDVASGVEVSRQSHERGYSGVALSDDATRVLSWGGDGAARIWDAATGAEISSVRHLGDARAAAFERQGEIIRADAVARGDTMTESIAGIYATTAEGFRASAGEGVVLGAAFAPDQQRALSWGRDGIVRVWDIATGRELASRDHQGSAHGAVFSDDGSRVLSWGLPISFESEERRGAAAVWSAETGELIAASNHSGEILGASFSWDGENVLSWGEDGVAKVWDAETGAEIARQDHGPCSIVVLGEAPLCVGATVLSNGRILSRGPDGEAVVWDGATGRRIAHAHHEGGVRRALYTAAGERLLSWGAADRTARAWSALGSPEGDKVIVEGGFAGLEFSPDGARALYWSAEGVVHVEDMATGEVLSQFTTSGEISGVSFIDNDRVVTWALDGVTVWDAVLGKRIVFAFNWSSTIDGMEISPEGERLLYWTRMGNAEVVGAKLDPELARELELELAEIDDYLPYAPRIAHQSHCEGTCDAGAALIAGVNPGDTGATFSPEGARVLSWSNDGSVRVWDAATGAVIAAQQHGACEEEIAQYRSDCAVGRFSPDGARVLSWGLDGVVRVWDAATGAVIAEQMHHPETLLVGEEARARSYLLGRPADGRVAGAAFSPSGARVVSWGDDDEVRIWDAATGAVVATVSHAGCAQPPCWTRAEASPDGDRIASWSADRILSVQTIETGEETARVTLDDEVEAVRFSSDGARLLTWRSEGAVQAWDPATGRALGRLGGGFDWIDHGFAPGGERVLSRSGDGVVIFWDVATGAEIARYVHVPCETDLRTASLGCPGARLAPSGAVISWGGDGIARGWAGPWAFGPTAREQAGLAPLLDAVCGPEGKLGGAARFLTDADVAAAPLLRGRVGDDVCDQPPFWSAPAQEFSEALHWVFRSMGGDRAESPS